MTANVAQRRHREAARAAELQLFNDGPHWQRTILEAREIVEDLCTDQKQFARAAVRRAIERREEVTPHLLRLLEETIERAAKEEEDAWPNGLGDIYAMLLLAQFREDRAYPLMIRLALLPAPKLDRVLGDFLTESFSRILASVYDGDVGSLHGLIENPNAYLWARVAGLEALVLLAREDRIARDDVVAYYRKRLVDSLHCVHDDDSLHLCTYTVCYALDLETLALRDEVTAVWDAGLVISEVVSAACIESAFDAVQKGQPEKRPYRGLIEDIEKEMSWLSHFRNDEAEKQKDGRSAFKVGRNDPCPCGSGRKHKKCCINVSE